MKSILKYLDGWKTVIGYILLMIPGLTDNPMLYKAIQDVLANFNKETATTAVIQIIIAVGILDRIKKNLAGMK